MTNTILDKCLADLITGGLSLLKFSSTLSLTFVMWTYNWRLRKYNWIFGHVRVHCKYIGYLVIMRCIANMDWCCQMTHVAPPSPLLFSQSNLVSEVMPRLRCITHQNLLHQHDIPLFIFSCYCSRVSQSCATDIWRFRSAEDIFLTISFKREPGLNARYGMVEVCRFLTFMEGGQRISGPSQRLSLLELGA